MGLNGRGSRGGFLVNDLPGTIQVLPNFARGAFDRLLAQVDGICEELAALLDGPGICALLQFDSFSFQELAEMGVQLALIDFIHALVLPES